jgi:hypothetical protein
MEKRGGEEVIHHTTHRVTTPCTRGKHASLSTFPTLSTIVGHLSNGGRGRTWDNTAYSASVRIDARLIPSPRAALTARQQAKDLPQLFTSMPTFPHPHAQYPQILVASCEKAHVVVFILGWCARSPRARRYPSRRSTSSFYHFWGEDFHLSTPINTLGTMFFPALFSAMPDGAAGSLAGQNAASLCSLPRRRRTLFPSLPHCVYLALTIVSFCSRT